MGSKIVVRCLGDGDYPRWNELNKRSPEGSIYSNPEYLDVLASQLNGQFRILAAEREGEILGGIALFEVNTAWGISVSPRNLLYYQGIVLQPGASKYPSQNASRRVETLGAIEEAVSQQGYGRLEIRSRSSLSDIRAFQVRGWKIHPTYTYVVQLRDMAQLWSGTEQNLRRLVSRCEKEGMSCTEDDDFDTFYRLHMHTHVRKGSAIYLPEASFRKYFERLRDMGLCRLFQARCADGRVASTQMVLLGEHPVTHTVSAGADPEFLRTGATAFLRWKVFERLSQLGYEGNDLTDASLNPVTHFKSQLGGDLELNFVISKRPSLRFRVRSCIADLARGPSAMLGYLRTAKASVSRLRPSPPEHSPDGFQRPQCG
jgi:hypothetical protein